MTSSDVCMGVGRRVATVLQGDVRGGVLQYTGVVKEEVEVAEDNPFVFCLGNGMVIDGSTGSDLR